MLEACPIIQFQQFKSSGYSEMPHNMSYRNRTTEMVSMKIAYCENLLSRDRVMQTACKIYVDAFHYDIAGDNKRHKSKAT